MGLNVSPGVPSEPGSQIRIGSCTCCLADEVVNVSEPEQETGLAIVNYLSGWRDVTGKNDFSAGLGFQVNTGKGSVI